MNLASRLHLPLEMSNTLIAGGFVNMSIKTKLYARAGLAPLLALVMLFSAGSVANAQATPPTPPIPSRPAPPIPPTRDPIPPVPRLPNPVPPSLIPVGDLKGNLSTSQQLAYNPPADMLSGSLQQGGFNAGPPKPEPVGPTPRPAPVPIPRPTPPPTAPPNQ